MTDDFDARWEAAKAGEELVPEWLNDADAPDVPPPEFTEFANLIARPAVRKQEPVEAITTCEMQPALTRAFEAIQARLERGGGLAGATSGLTRLDEAIDGWQRKRLYVVGGRTGMGKSIVGLNLAMGLAANGNGVDFLSLEMPTEEQALRCLLAASQVPHWRIKNNTVKPEDWRGLTTSIEQLRKWPWRWDDRGGVTALQVVEQVCKARDSMCAAGQDLHTVVVDHVQEIRGTNARAPRREQIVDIMSELKAMAVREDLCVIALAQIGRGTEARNQKDRRPRMADLQEAGAIEQKADAVMLLFREDYYAEKGDPKTNVLDVALPKIRGGEPAFVKLRFAGACYRVDNLAPGDEP